MARLSRLLGRPWRSGHGARDAHRLGVGDDAAVVPGHGGRGGYCVACCDLLVEDVDFRRRWAPFAHVGHKAAAANLSDLAAMGASPTGLLLGLALSPNEAVADVLALVRGVHALGQKHGAPLVGGDLSATRGPLVVSVTALGALRGHAPLRRGGARLGDAVVVFGSLGAARAGLSLLEADAGRALRAAAPRRPRGRAWPAGRPAFAAVAGARATPWATPRPIDPASGSGTPADAVYDALPAWARTLARRQSRPSPQVKLGAALAAVAGVHSVADVSDGLLADAGHLVRPPLGITLAARALPVAPGVARAASWLHGAAAARAKALRWAACGGEDYVLVAAVAQHALAAVAEAARATGARAHLVGRVTRVAGVRLVDRHGDEVLAGAAAYQHFGTG